MILVDGIFVRVVIAIILGVTCFWLVKGDFYTLSPGADPFNTIIQFVSAAFNPTWTDQSTSLPEGARPFIPRLLDDLWRTIRFAGASISIAVPLAIILGFLGSRWVHRSQLKSLTLRPESSGSRLVSFCLGISRSLVHLGLITGRSLHALIWALLFLSIIGDVPLAGILALAIPNACVMGNMFAKQIDEHISHAPEVLHFSGGGIFQTFSLAVFPQVLPGFISYAFYRFECAMRSSIVLGFVGFECIGLTLVRSFENLYFREVWTILYTIIAIIFLFDKCSALIRASIVDGKYLRRPRQSSKNDSGTHDHLELNPDTLKKVSVRDPILRGLAAGMFFLIIACWVGGGSMIHLPENNNGGERILRFITEITPEPARPESYTAPIGDRLGRLWQERPEIFNWFNHHWQDQGLDALGYTLVVSVVSISLAGLIALVATPFSSRLTGTTDPYGIPVVLHKNRTMPWMRFLYLVPAALVRYGYVFARALPEYVYAFILISLLGPGVWPLILALMIHNAGILGRLWGEVAENAASNSPAPAVIYASGATRWQSWFLTLIPANFYKFFHFYSYRWETCVREAIVLGFLGVPTLGYHIFISHAFLRYDQMLFFVVLGILPVFVFEFMSRRSSSVQ